MTAAQYEFLVDLLKASSGLALGDDKRYLVEARLAPLARRFGFVSLGKLVARLADRDDLELRRQVVEAMTTNETFFFRDVEPFRAFAEVMLPALAARRRPGEPIRVWSAACSTGQEAFSLAMTVAENAASLGGRRVEIVATDLSQHVVDRAREGLFSQFEVQRGLPIRQLLKHFTQEGDRWRIAPALLEMVSFRTLNLVRDFSALGRFDIVFCRNLLIYFDAAAKADLLDRLGRQIAPDGYLVLGAAEALVGAAGGGFRAAPDASFVFLPQARSQKPSLAVVR